MVEVARMQVDRDEPEIVERVAALDVGKAEVVCCVRVPGQGGRRLQEVRTVSTMTASLLELGDWLSGLGVTRVVMEATSDYWRAPFYLLEDRFQTWLVNAKDVKHLPGRPKTDLLTELAESMFGRSGGYRSAADSVRARDQRFGCAGFVGVGGAAAGGG